MDKLDNSAPFDDDQGTRIAGKPTGAGAEAAEGIHGEPATRHTDRDPSDTSSLEDGPADDGERRGSEPLTHSRPHGSSYGGGGGKPKKAPEPDR